VELFEAQAGSRHLDLAARVLRGKGLGFYTIGSSGHEGNAGVAAALRPDDPAFLHYRSGAFFLERGRQLTGELPLLDVLLGLVASSDDPISGGRHKVFGSRAMWIPPQTSTIASHLPKAMGLAFMLDRAARLGLPLPVPRTAIVACSFGDASVNHSTASGAINTACWAAFQGLPMPILFVCEDNAIGISVRTPPGWIAASQKDRPGLRYFAADGLDVGAVLETATEAAGYVRASRKPAFLHLSLVRLLAHAGADEEQSYRSAAEIEADEAKDPLLRTAQQLVESRTLRPDTVLSRYEEIRRKVAGLAEDAAKRPRLSSRAEVVAPLAPQRPEAVAAEVARPIDAEARAKFWQGQPPDKPAHLAEHINRALGDLLVKYPELFVFGEDVAQKGGVYNVTHDLLRRAGVGRVFNTLLDEQSILGLALGAGHLGCIAIPEIQYLAYLHNAEDQLRGEAASLQFFSRGQFQNPTVVRVASYAYQKGFGGHFHNDNSVAVLRDIPGLVIASPARGDDAAAMLRTCVAAARVQGSVCVFLEPIALYMTRDLHAPKDDGWLTTYSQDGEHVPLGAARAYGEGKDLLIVSWANGLWMSLRAARRLEEQGIRCRVLDLRWLRPLPVPDLLREAKATGRVLVVDETRGSGGVSEEIFTALVEGGFTGRMRRVTAADSYIPLGPAAEHVLVHEREIEAGAQALARQSHG
jgi:2-oxoisovalerate dehydrogenase E1 component